jgi:phosphatidate cytidylyltransferase
VRNLIWRVGTGAVFLPVLYVLIQAGGWAYTALVFLVVVVGAWEWWRLGVPAAGPLDLALLVAGALGALQGGADPRPERLAVFLALWLTLVLLAGLRHADGGALRRAGHLTLGVLYVGLLPAFLLRQRALPEGGEALLLTYFTVFACDTAAYASGRLAGRHALWPRISPRKTWEGAAGGLLGALAAAMAGRAWFAGFLSPGAAVGFGLIAGTLGQLGDLVESLLKREAGAKDSSALIPGHGGVLDRFDNLHFVAPALYAYLTLWT